MRVLFIVRRNLEQHRGGDTTQILSTARELRAKGVEVDVETSIPRALAGWDLVHLFHLDRLWENLPAARAVGGRLPMVLSTIWWPKYEYNAHSRPGLQGVVSRAVGTRAYDSLRVFQRSLVAFAERPGVATLPRPGAWPFIRAGRELLRMAELVLPNSEEEQRALERYFRVAVPYRVVPNGADVELDPEVVVSWPHTDVLCVGNFEPRKNQDKIIQALRGTGLSVSFAGGGSRFSASYEQGCRRAAGPDIRFLGFVPHGQLQDLYRSARVHVLPSWFETPGLSSLEAAALGCPIVVGDSPSVREYFADLAHYCNPGSVESIRTAIFTALGRPRDPALAALVRSLYTWERAAAATLAAYEEALRAIPSRVRLPLPLVRAGFSPRRTRRQP